MNGTACGQLVIPSPIGPLCLTGHEGGLTKLIFADAEDPLHAETNLPVLRLAAKELEQYFAGRLRTFTVPLDPAGTPFQRLVWQGLRQIPYGEAVSYKRLAEAIGRPTACRAVGMANHRNPLPILIPCHRVINADGTLGGYGGGLAIKRTLLTLENISFIV